ncbi:MAG TPA: mechanosensitive ion channel family protein [Acidimicrobiia bacterium]|jgi:small conductance mechanosensitive channel|nr:mechanosensitive ion channel family protein [Acidimicrobiia bacterium]
MAMLAQEVVEDLTTTGSLMATAVIIVVAVVVYWLASTAGRRYVERMSARGHDRASRAQTLWVVLRRLILLAILITAVAFVFTVWGWSLAPFLAVGTVLAAAFGFGAQNLVRDFLAGFFIVLENQFHVGDVVTIAGVTGAVEDIQLRVTLLRDEEGNQHYVPNGQIVVTSNFTANYALPVIDVAVPYSTDLDHALDVLSDELQKLAADPGFQGVITGSPEVLGVEDVRGAEVILRGRLRTRPDKRWMVKREALKRVTERFESEGIFPPS